VIFIILVISTWLATRQALKGKARSIRPIPALEAIYEGIGRAVEMGRPVFMTPGAGDIGRAPVMAGLAILDAIATQCAKLDVRLFTVFGHGALAAAELVVSEAYKREGKLDAYSPGKQVIYFSGDQYARTAAGAGLYQREKIALNVLIGDFYSEVLYLGEAAARVGAMQIGGTVQQLGIPLMAITMDYLVIADEMYAMAAAITKDPLEIGSITAQDIGKIIIYCITIIGVIAMMLGSKIVIDLLGA
jgi:hypothetical protein